MNRTLKIAMAAAIATLGLAGQAHALTQSTSTNSGDMFLYVFGDRTLDSSNTNSAIFDLGPATSFNTGATQSFDFSSNSAWTTYVATIANPTSIKWGVYGASGSGSAGSVMFTTETAGGTPYVVKGTTFNTTISKANALDTVYGGASCTTCGFSVKTTNDAATQGAWNNTAGITAVTLTAGLNSNLDFYQYVSTGTGLGNTATATALSSAGAQDYFTLSNAGVLSYTAAAPVPEADSYALMLAGLGLVGLLARRRKV